MNKPQLIQKVEKNKTDLGTVLDRGFVDTVWHGGFTEEEWNANRDWNRVIKNGYYRANSWDTEEKNLPSVSKFGSQIGTIIVTNVSNTIHQEFTTPSGIFFRSSGDNGVTWKEWEKIATENQFSGFKIYNSISQLSLDANVTTMDKIAQAMDENSILIHKKVAKEANPNYPSTDASAVLTVIKTDQYRVEYSFTYNVGTGKAVSYFGYFNASYGFSGWKQTAITDQIDILWEGNITNDEITLNKSITEGYHTVTVQTQHASGYGYTPYTIERAPYTVQVGTKYSIPTALNSLDIFFSADGTKATISNSSVMLRRIVGIKYGSR